MDATYIRMETTGGSRRLRAQRQTLLMRQHWRGWGVVGSLLLLLGGCATLPEGIGGGEESRVGNLGERSQESPADLYVNLAVEYLRRQAFPQALQNAREAVRRDANNADAHNVLALVYDQLDETSHAERHFQRALSLQPKNPYYRNAYGFFLCKRSRYPAAEQEFLRALDNPLYSTPAVALNNAGICTLRSGNSAKAEEYFIRALRHEPRLASALLEMADLSLKQDKVALAREYLRRFHAVSGRSARSLWLGIQIARILGDRDTEASLALQLRSNFPDSDEYLQLMGARHR